VEGRSLSIVKTTRRREGMADGLFATVEKERTPGFPPRSSARRCGKYGHRGQLRQWWKISFRRACLCFSVQNRQSSRADDTEKDDKDFDMPQINEPHSSLEKVDNTVEQLVEHLLRWPCDLIDACHLLHRFQASAVDFQHALARLEEIAAQPSS